MQELFLETVQLSLTGSLFALAVMLVRGVFRKAPKWLFCLLWGIVALRLFAAVHPLVQPRDVGGVHSPVPGY
ncbi:MAG: hypothetical protein ACI4PO_05930 [Faecousia sp.]